MFERFTDQARRAIVLSQQESRLRQHWEIDVGHIVLGALTASKDAGLADRTVEAVSRAVASTLVGQIVDHGHTGHIPFTRAAKVVLERSVQLSLQDHRMYVDSRDVLIAGLTQPDLAEPLAAEGLDLDRLERTIVDGRAAAAEDPGPVDPVAVTVLMPDDSQVIVDLLHQILRRLDAINERLQRRM